MKILYVGLVIVALLALAVPCVHLYFVYVANPRNVRELIDDPDGERAQKVMLLTLPSGRRIPVNYLREGDRVYAGADGRWWKELADGEERVTVLIRGETLEGQGRAVVDDPDYTKQVFARLRPNALPGFGTLIEVRLDGGSAALR
jgi:hypothetical protein